MDERWTPAMEKGRQAYLAGLHLRQHNPYSRDPREGEIELHIEWATGWVLAREGRMPSPPDAH